jgi:hypothetical protein
MSLDPAAHDALLHLLQPVSDRLAAASSQPPHVARADWLGPASDACERLEGELAARLGRALAAVDVALARIRTELAP